MQLPGWRGGGEHKEVPGLGTLTVWDEPVLFGGGGLKYSAHQAELGCRPRRCRGAAVQTREAGGAG